MAPPHTTSATRPSDDLDDLFNFLDADTSANTSQNQNNNTTDENAAPPPRRRLDGDDPLGLGLGIDEEIKVRKPRAPVAKLDEERLLSEMGIPRLRRITKDRLRFKGKGHEFQDVSRLLNTYQLWLDALFPKANFADGIAIIEKLGHKKRIQMMRKSWIDEDKPKPTQDYDDDFVDVDQVMKEGDDGTGVEKDGNNADARQVEGIEGNMGRRGPTNTGGNGQVSSPPLDDDEGLYDEVGPPMDRQNREAEDQEPDEDELDALLAEDAANANTPATQTAKHVPPQAPPGEPDFADDEEAMAEMDMW